MFVFICLLWFHAPSILFPNMSRLLNRRHIFHGTAPFIYLFFTLWTAFHLFVPLTEGKPHIHNKGTSHGILHSDELLSGCLHLFQRVSQLMGKMKSNCQAFPHYAGKKKKVFPTLKCLEIFEHRCTILKKGPDSLNRLKGRISYTVK